MHSKIMFMLTLQLEVWHKENISRRWIQSHTETLEPPLAVIACALPMVFVPFLIIFSISKTLPLISRQISNPDTNSSRSQQTAQHRQTAARCMSHPCGDISCALCCACQCTGRTFISWNRTEGEANKVFMHINVGELKAEPNRRRECSRWKTWTLQREQENSQNWIRRVRPRKEKEKEWSEELEESLKNGGENCQKMRFVIHKRKNEKKGGWRISGTDSLQRCRGLKRKKAKIFASNVLRRHKNMVFYTGIADREPEPFICRSQMLPDSESDSAHCSSSSYRIPAVILRGCQFLRSRIHSSGHLSQIYGNILQQHLTFVMACSFS